MLHAWQQIPLRSWIHFVSPVRVSEAIHYAKASYYWLRTSIQDKQTTCHIDITQKKRHPFGVSYLLSNVLIAILLNYKYIDKIAINHL